IFSERAPSSSPCLVRSVRQISNIRDNQLSSLPVGLLDGLDALQYLLLDDNELASVSAGIFGGLDALIFLSLYENQLASLPAGIFYGWDTLHISIYIATNSLRSPRGFLTEM
ncbi:unnamed protein product, partial [Ectocarpus sp. 12 AP-2014]